MAVANYYLYLTTELEKVPCRFKVNWVIESQDDRRVSESVNIQIGARQGEPTQKALSL